MIKGISHITFIVKDLERTARFLTAVFGAQEVYSSEKKQYSISHEKFFVIEGLWLCIMEGDPLSERTYNHIAFKVDDDNFDGYVERVRMLEVDIRPGRSRIAGEGRSVYFYDYDNHLFELHTGTLEERLSIYE